MSQQAADIVSQTIYYIEEHLDQKLDLDALSAALHYSKFYLHRIFTKTLGFTMHDYIRRRQITEAARLLVCSQISILEIALLGGYESRQAFTDIFKALYKTTPAEYREAQEFYPLQLEIHLCQELRRTDFTKEEIRTAAVTDIEDWMKLVRLTLDGYPHLQEREYIENLRRYIAAQEALILRDQGIAAGAMAFSAADAHIDFLAVHPQYRSLGITKLFLDKLREDLLPGREISLTTYRAGDKADRGSRREYQNLGFAAGELLTEYGYPTQRFVLGPKDAPDRQKGTLL